VDVFKCGFCKVWMCLCVGFVKCGCFGNVCTCIYCVLYCFIVFLYCFVYVYLFFFVMSVLFQGLLPPSDNSIAFRSNGNNNDNDNGNNNIFAFNKIFVFLEQSPDYRLP
jgi:hypothetical protein